MGYLSKFRLGIQFQQFLEKCHRALSTEFNPLIFQTLALKNVRGHARDLSRTYFRALHQDLSAGWCSDLTLASCAEGPGLYPRLMQVVQLSHLSEFFLMESKYNICHFNSSLNVRKCYWFGKSYYESRE